MNHGIWEDPLFRQNPRMEIQLWDASSYFNTNMIATRGEHSEIRPSLLFTQLHWYMVCREQPWNLPQPRKLASKMIGVPLQIMGTSSSLANLDLYLERMVEKTIFTETLHGRENGLHNQSTGRSAKNAFDAPKMTHLSEWRAFYTWPSWKVCFTFGHGYYNAHIRNDTMLDRK